MHYESIIKSPVAFLMDFCSIKTSLKRASKNPELTFENEQKEVA